MAQHFSELVCWQLARDLRNEVFRLSSAASNIAEGFGRRSHRDFAHFLDMSRASVNEIANRLGESAERRYLDEDEIATALNLVVRTRSATSRLMAYLLTTPTPNRPGSPPRRRGHR
jgi:hypothetical protein